MDGSVLDRLGATISGRYEKCLEEAAEIVSNGLLTPKAWRRDFCRAVVKKYFQSPLGSEVRAQQRMVWRFLCKMTAQELKALRVVCIGEGAERIYELHARRLKEALTHGSEYVAAQSRKELEARVDAAYQRALSGLPPDKRNIDALAQALSMRRVLVESYLFAHPELALKLNDGQRCTLSVRDRLKQQPPAAG